MKRERERGVGKEGEGVCLASLSVVRVYCRTSTDNLMENYELQSAPETMPISHPLAPSSRSLFSPTPSAKMGERFIRGEFFIYVKYRHLNIFYPMRNRLQRGDAWGMPDPDVRLACRKGTE